MKKMLGLLLAGMILIGSVGCESKEEHEARVIEAVENKIM